MEKVKMPAAQPSCLTCRYFDTLSQIHQATQVTVCRLKPPVPFAAAGMTPRGEQVWMTTAAWLAVQASDWCAEHLSRLAS